MKSALERRFGDFRLDLRRGLLLRNNAEVKLRPKAFEALKLLAENQGRLVSKSELMESLWPGTAVTEDSLAHCIMEVRRALGEEGPKRLRTVTGRGYLFEGDDAVEEEAKPILKSTGPVPRRLLWAIPLLLLLFALGYWRWQENRVENALRDFETFAAHADYPKAFEAAQTVLAIRPTEDRVVRLWNEVSDNLTIHSSPSDADVEILQMGESTPRALGRTPIDRFHVARGDYIIRIRKAGFAPVERIVSSALPRSRPIVRTPWDLSVDASLPPLAGAPAGMVQIPALKQVTLALLDRPASHPVDLASFWLDRFEVTNEEFQRFVDSGRHPPNFLDSSGIPGPASWSGGRAPKALLQHPVTGVSWEEARAYCRFAGKNLPTVYQWESAARYQIRIPFGLLYPWGLLNADNYQQRANFHGSSTRPVGSYPFGMSYLGVYDMAGNVREWLLNRRLGGRATVGASWRDEVYQFMLHGWAPEDTRRDDLGFRCALGEDKAGAIDLYDEDPQVYPPPLSNAAFDRFRAFYSYPDRPLAPRIVASLDGGTWTRQEIRFRAANDEEALAYLYLPKHAQAPYQTIHFLGGTNWFVGAPITSAVEGNKGLLEPFLRAGRAVFLVAFKGMHGRPPVGERPVLEAASSRWKTIMRDRVIDMRRGVDYLHTRADIDHNRIIFWNHSTTESAALISALETRYRGTLLVGAGIGPDGFELPPIVNAAVYAPFMNGPKLIINGRYDEYNPELTVGLPFFNVLRAPKKRVLVDDGHIPGLNLVIPIAQPWLNEVLGNVKLR